MEDYIELGGVSDFPIVQTCISQDQKIDMSQKILALSCPRVPQ